MDAVRALASAGPRLFVEVGPHPVLAGMARRCLSTGSGVWLSSLRKEKDDNVEMLTSLATLYVTAPA